MEAGYEYEKIRGVGFNVNGVAPDLLRPRFCHPNAVFSEEMLRPELQDAEIFADGLDNIVATHQRVAESYFNDGSAALACPPLRALLEIMVHGKTAGGEELGSSAVRQLFTPASTCSGARGTRLASTLSRRRTGGA